MSADTFNKKISGTITNVPPPSLPRDKFGMGIIAPLGTPIEGVKVTDGEKVVLSDKNGFYEIETAKGSLVFSKENYANQTFNTNHFPIGMPSFKKSIVLKKLDSTTTETKTETKTATEEEMLFGFKKKFLVNVALVLGVFGLGWYFYKSKNK